MKLVRVLCVTLALVVALAVTLGMTGCATDGDSDESADSGGEASTSDGPVRVTLTWSEDADLDLEIWSGDESQGELLTRAFALSGADDVGPDGMEYFDFEDYGSGDDFSTGEYVVSVYFADYTDDDRAVAHLEVEPSGEIAEAGMEFIGQDQWHAFSVDAETGEIEMIDEFIEPTVTE
jgi:hypothetical protein